MQTFGVTKNIETVVNTSLHSVEKCRRLVIVGGFKYGEKMRKIYGEMKELDKKATTIYVPIAEKDFSYTIKKYGISYEAELTDKELIQLQRIYKNLYEQRLSEVRFSSTDTKHVYSEIKKVRNKVMSDAKYIFYRDVLSKKK